MKGRCCAVFSNSEKSETCTWMNFNFLEIDKALIAYSNK